jgi:hypothetical protein
MKLDMTNKVVYIAIEELVGLINMTQHGYYGGDILISDKDKQERKVLARRILKAINVIIAT